MQTSYRPPPLDFNNEDPEELLVYSDYLEECGQQREADYVRQRADFWLWVKGQNYQPAEEVGSWFWDNRNEVTAYESERYPLCSRLPATLYDKLSYGQPLVGFEKTYTKYATKRHAFADLFVVYLAVMASPWLERADKDVNDLINKEGHDIQ